MQRICAVLSALLLMLGCMPAVAAGEREVAHEIHEFAVGSEVETQYLIKKASFNDAGVRFADGKQEIIYRFDLTNTLNLRAVTLSGALYQQLLLSVSSDGMSYTEVYRWVGEVKPNGSGGLDKERRCFDLTPYLDLENLKTVYVKIADSYTSGGWGGALHPSERVALDVTYLPPSKEEQDADEMTSDEHTVPLLGCNDTLGSHYTLKTERPFGGSGALYYTLGVGDPSVTLALPQAVDGTGMDTVELAVYVSDTALFSTLASGTVTLGSAGGGRLSWTMRSAFATIEAPRVGWNVVSLPLGTAQKAGGFDLARVTSVALEWDTTVGGGTFGIDSIRLTDTQARLRATAIARIQSLLDLVGRLDALNTDRLGEHNFKEIARVCRALRQDYDALEGADLLLADEMGVRSILTATEAAIAAYEDSLSSGMVMPEIDAPNEQGGEEFPTLTPPSARPEDDVVPPADERGEQEPTEHEEGRGGMHPTIVVVLVAAIGAALTAAVMAARKKEKTAKK